MLEGYPAYDRLDTGNLPVRARTRSADLDPSRLREVPDIDLIPWNRNLQIPEEIQNGIIPYPEEIQGITQELSNHLLDQSENVITLIENFQRLHRVFHTIHGNIRAPGYLERCSNELVASFQNLGPDLSSYATREVCVRSYPEHLVQFYSKHHFPSISTSTDVSFLEAKLNILRFWENPLINEHFHNASYYLNDYILSDVVKIFIVQSSSLPLQRTDLMLGVFDALVQVGTF